MNAPTHAVVECREYTPHELSETRFTSEVFNLVVNGDMSTEMLSTSEFLTTFVALV
jgi:hypothetical protein